MWGWLISAAMLFNTNNNKPLAMTEVIIGNNDDLKSAMTWNTINAILSFYLSFVLIQLNPNKIKIWSYFLESPSKSRIYSNISRTSLFFAIVTIEIKEVFKKEHIVRRERYTSCISTTNSKSLYHYQVQIFYNRALILIALVRLIG